MFGQVRLKWSDRAFEGCWLETFFQTHQEVCNAKPIAIVSDYEPGNSQYKYFVRIEDELEKI